MTAAVIQLHPGPACATSAETALPWPEAPAEGLRIAHLDTSHVAGRIHAADLPKDSTQRLLQAVWNQLGDPWVLREGVAPHTLLLPPPRRADYVHLRDDVLLRALASPQPLSRNTLDNLLDRLGPWSCEEWPASMGVALVARLRRYDARPEHALPGPVEDE